MNIYSYKGTIVQVLAVEPDRLMLQECKSGAVAWADWSDFHELAEPYEGSAFEWRAEEVTIDDNSAWCVCRNVVGTGNKERRPKSRSVRRRQALSIQSRSGRDSELVKRKEQT